MNQALKNDNEPSTDQYLISNNLRLCYDEFGDQSKPAIVLVMGLGTQMIAWTDEFCQGLADFGYRVIRYDNRDIGLSEKIKLDKPVSIPRIMLRKRFGLSVKVPYTLNDMATDAIGVLDALNIEKAHFVGASMGGMISQLVAANYPERCISLTSIMSSSGNPTLPVTSLKVTKLMVNRPKVPDEDAIVTHGIKLWRVIGSPDYPASDEALTTKILRSVRRSLYPLGYRNHMAAILENGDRREQLKKITAPTLVIHGKGDVLVPVDAGIDTAKHIINAELKLIEGMGHDLPVELVPRIVRMIGEHVNSVDSK